MAGAAGSSHQHERSCSHAPTFSAQHPMIPKLYVMPWKQDMKNQRLLMKESLWFCGRERLCHSQESPSSSFALLTQSGQTAHHSSHFSRYNSSVVTTRRLYQT
ncbi:hypothetical protein KUCAC02_028945 [Chaenocephalus aceratus]|uniref:Uncharacterized protein n=1 Tax=Chaenocephalus aceratus TaxID=36190 RepID=A0ACB9X3J4_CHAAC|nr:hypothetical protein KUCAC02_028945 [Chaenocephalus aceratus]